MDFNRQQLRHFTEHGWILIEKALDSSLTERLIKSLMRDLEQYGGARRHVDGVDLKYIDHLIGLNEVYREILYIPGFLQSNMQVAGCATTLKNAFALITSPHPERNTRTNELVDHDTLGWHRGMRPKWASFPHDEDPNLMNFPYLNCFAYLTDVGPNDGGTWVLDRSHLKDGDYESLKEELEVVQITAPAGSILMFSETLIHSGGPILSERTRYAIDYTFVPPWFSNFQDYQVPEFIYGTVRNDHLRGVLGAWRGELNQKLMRSFAYELN